MQNMVVDRFKILELFAAGQHQAAVEIVAWRNAKRVEDGMADCFLRLFQ